MVTKVSINKEHWTIKGKCTGQSSSVVMQPPPPMLPLVSVRFSHAQLPAQLNARHGLVLVRSKCPRLVPRQSSSPLQVRRTRAAHAGVSSPIVAHSPKRTVWVRKASRDLQQQPRFSWGLQLHTNIVFLLRVQFRGGYDNCARYAVSHSQPCYRD